MHPSRRHHLVEERMRELLDSADLPTPDEVAHLTRAVIFIWYDTKAFVLVDLDEMPPDGDPLEGLDVGRLAIDIEDRDPLRLDGRDGFIEAA